MEIATIDSIINKNKVDYKDIMENFVKWLTEAKYTPHGIVFDKGITCMEAILRYRLEKNNPIDCGSKLINSNGNGSLMRMLPIAYYCYYKKIDYEKIYEIIKNVSSLTHAHEISILGCYIYVHYVLLLLKGNNKFSSYNKVKLIDYSKFDLKSLKVYSRFLKDDIKRFDISDIKSSGYIVDSLEASMWVLLNTDNYKEAIINSINLGNDTDTIGAITGSMAGIIYGYNSMPKKWLAKLVKRQYLEELCDKFEKTICD